MVIGSEFDEQVEDLVDHGLGALLDPIHLVDDDEWAQTARERLADHEARLGHHALDGIHQQQDAIHHSEDALDLAAEVGVTRRVDQVNPNPLEADAGLLGVDRDAAFALQILAVHHPFGDFLVLAKRTGLAQETVEQSRLAVVDMRDDREVPEVFTGLLTHWAGTLADQSRSGRVSTGEPDLADPPGGAPLRGSRASGRNPPGGCHASGTLRPHAISPHSTPAD